MTSASLAAAIETWRVTRDLELARRIDALSAAIPIEAPPAKVHHWWIERARSYDPIVATTLIAHVATRANRDNVIERTDMMLAWPDDPRVIVRIAQLEIDVHLESHRQGIPRRSADPRRDAILRRAVAMREARALEILGAAWPSYDKASRAIFRDAVETVPEPSEPAADPVVDALWATVVDEPHQLQRRLVLADALTERGDPRGEMIALQCAPLLAIERGTTEPIDGLFGRSAYRVTELVAANWHRWLGDVALVATRASKFRGGLLDDVQVGPLAAPAWAWERAAHDRELCAVRRLSATSHITPQQYLAFAHALPGRVKWLHLDENHVAALDRAPPASGIVIDRSYTNRRGLGELVADVFAVAPNLEYLGVHAYHVTDLQELCTIAPRLRVKQLRVVFDEPIRDASDLIAALRTLPFVRVDAYGL